MKLYLILCVFFASSVLSAQPEKVMPSEPGKCYAKCLIGSKYEIETDLEYVYTGSDFSIDGIEEYIYETGDQVEIYFIVTDTSLVKDYVELPFDYEVEIQKGGFSEWREIACAADVTIDLYADVQKALITHGYDVGPDGADGQFGVTTKSALVQYQKDNELPVGALDYETLDSLGVYIMDY